MIVTFDILHIAFAAAWFGHKLLLPGDVRRSIHAGQTESEALVGRLRRAQRLGIVTGLGTLLSGGALIWFMDPGTVDIGIWVGLGLFLAAVAMEATMARSASKAIREAVTDTDRVAATVAGRQLNRMLGFASLLWMGALTAMVV